MSFPVCSVGLSFTSLFSTVFNVLQQKRAYNPLVKESYINWPLGMVSSAVLNLISDLCIPFMPLS